MYKASEYNKICHLLFIGRSFMQFPNFIVAYIHVMSNHK